MEFERPRNFKSEKTNSENGSLQEKFEVQKRAIEKKEEDSLLGCLERFENNNEHMSIGEGGNAEVFVLKNGKYGEVCVKLAKEIPMMKCNPIEIEHAYQEEVLKLGINTPQTILIAKNNETNKEYIIMERINGPSLSDILDRNEKFPETFDFNNFFKKLEEQVAILHKNNLHHRDLHEGNVMINEEGEPVIIDFGTMTRAFAGDENEMYHDAVPMLNPKTGRYDMARGYFQRDNGKVGYLKSAIKSYMQEKGLM